MHPMCSRTCELVESVAPYPKTSTEEYAIRGGQEVSQRQNKAACMICLVSSIDVDVMNM